MKRIRIILIEVIKILISDSGAMKDEHVCYIIISVGEILIQTSITMCNRTVP